MASNEMDSAMVYEYTGAGLRMLQADSNSRPVTHSTAIRDPIPCQATVGAVDRQGRVLFLAPEPETFGPERNMYTAVQYYLGQTPAGIVQGNLRHAGRDDTGGSETRAAGCSSSSHQEGAQMPLFAQLSAEASPIGVEGPGLGLSTDPPGTTGRSEGDLAHSDSCGCRNKTACTKPATKHCFLLRRLCQASQSCRCCLRFLPSCKQAWTSM